MGHKFIVIARSPELVEGRRSNLTDTDENRASLRGVLSLSKDDEAISLIQMDKESYIYILSNQQGNVLYTGVTSNLVKRVYEHREKLVDGFTSKYNVNKLVYFEAYDSIDNAIKREKQIKGGPRKKKVQLIESINPNWTDLYEKILD